MCLLRERGQTEEAERLRAEELMRMVGAIRAPTDTDAAMTERLNAIFAIESERVANAAVLAELLAPMLAGQTRPADQPEVPRTATVIANTSSPPETPPPPPKRRAAGSIADFIDEMITQETPPPSSSRGAHRRAS